MPICKPTALKGALKPSQRLLGLDVGSKTIGMALSDALHMVATPFDVINRAKFSKDAAGLLNVVDTHDVGGLVVGLPVQMDGHEGRQAQSVRTFVANLLELRDLPTSFWDERMSTSAVERYLVDEADLSRSKRAKVIDRAAAAYILQGALDYMRST